MNWKKRVRKIAQTNPDALHPIFNRDIADNPAWYRVEWNKDSQHQDNASKMLLSIFNWLMEKHLLTAEGLEILEQAKTRKVFPLSLSHSHALNPATEFFDAYFEKWFEEIGHNLIINPENVETPLAKLEDFWMNWSENLTEN